MPFINVKWAGELSEQERKEIIGGITDSIHNATGKPKEAILVCIEQSPRDFWGKAGQLLQKPA
jgi:4-oxalocrotonate tautomerase